MTIEITTWVICGSIVAVTCISYAVWRINKALKVASKEAKA